jgi:uncharacterized RDD family membrane protein YckC
MSERPSDSSGLSSGDPLAGAGAGERSAPAEEPTRPAPEHPGAYPSPEAPQPGAGYTGPPPPGAGGPVRAGGYGAPAALGGRYVLSGWWRRVGARVIDGIIVGIGATILFVAIAAPFSIGFFASDEVGFVSLVIGALLAVVCIAIVATLYAPALMARTNGKTLGRQATGIRVVRADGQPITFGFAMLREVAVKALLFGIAGSITGGLANLIDVLWPLWDEENRALHDFVVNTRTVMDG